MRELSSHLSQLFPIAPVAVALSVVLFAGRWLTSAENLAAALAARKRAAILAIAIAAIVGRLSLLWLYPVPVPAVHDEFSYLLAADTFAHGKLTNPPHPMWIFFDTFHVLQQPTYMSKYPPAQGATLALGQLLGHPWLGVLLSMAFLCASVTWMLQAWFPPEWALLGGTFVLLRLGLFTYWINSYWGGAVAAAAGALVLGSFPRIIHHQRVRDSLLLAAGAALLANSRPLEGFIFCIPVAIALTVWLVSKTSPNFETTAPRVVLPLLCILTLTVLFAGYYNWRITGNPLLPPQALAQQRYENMNLLAWQPQKPPLHYSNPQFDYYFNVALRQQFAPTFAGWKYRSWRWIKGTWQLFFGSLLSIPFLAVPWVFRDRRTRLLLVQLCLSVAGLLSVIYLEPHYAAPLVATIFALWVQSMRHLRRWKLFGKPIGLALSRVIVLAALLNVPVFIVQRALNAQTEAEPLSVSRARMVQQLDATPGLHLVIVRYSPDRTVQNEWVYNAADIDNSKVVWAREIPGSDLQPLFSYFNNRHLWLAEPDASPPRLRPYPVP
ncbi:MAG: hypothetical protein WAL56_00475 [Candidatus Sulfotelmatobacter sp.]